MTILMKAIYLVIGNLENVFVEIIMIKLSLPPTTNHIYQFNSLTKRMYMTKEARAWKEEAKWLIKAGWKKKPLLDEVCLKVVYYLKRERDLDGGNKLLLDAMEDFVYLNDKQVVELHLYKKWDKKDPRLEVEVL